MGLNTPSHSIAHFAGERVKAGVVCLPGNHAEGSCFNRLRRQRRQHGERPSTWVAAALQSGNRELRASQLFHWSQSSLLSTQFSSVTQLCPTLCVPMGCSTPGLPVHRQLPEFIQTHVHQVGDTIPPSHPLSSPSPPFNLFQHQGLFQWVSSSGGQSIGTSVSASVLPMNNLDWFPLGRTGGISLQSKGLSRDLSNTMVQQHSTAMT